MDVNNNSAYGVRVPSHNAAYGVSSQSEDGQLPTSEALYEFVGISATATVNTNDDTVTGDTQEKFNNSSSRKICLIFGIVLSTAVLALVVAMVSVGLSAVPISKLEMQSILEDVKRLELSLNRSQRTNFNSNSEIQLLSATVNDLLLSLNQSVNTIDVLGQQISALQTDTVTQYGILNQLQEQIAQTQFNSCSEISTDRSRPSGEYWILGNSSSVQVYCDMSRTCCNTTGGWMRAANLDMTDPNQQCPDGFLQHNETTPPLRTCGRHGPGCVSTTFPVHGIEYSRVCGRVIGYQFGTPNAFRNYIIGSAVNINGVYVDGVSLTHGQLPRKHIWTFAAALDEVYTYGSANSCPCIRSDISFTGVVPPFIGEDYFCDTGSRRRNQFVFYPDDPLWNGKGCGGTSTCCSFNNPPWFCKQLPQPTTDDIELRLCAESPITDEDMLLELVDIFVN